MMHELTGLSTAYPASTILSVAFHTFNDQHIMVLSAITILGIGVVLVARRGSTAQRKWLRMILGFLLLGYAAFFYIPQGIRNELTWQNSLPLELCNLILIGCIISLFRPIRLITEIVYYLGGGGVLQATLTPDLSRGFPSLDFTLFFWGHGVSLLAIIFLISSRNFKPGKGSVVRMMAFLNIYGVLVGTIDAIFGWNYGYLCQKPSMPSLLDFLGPWPWYLLSIEGIALATFMLLDLPWRLVQLKRISLPNSNFKN